MLTALVLVRFKEISHRCVTDNHFGVIDTIKNDSGFYYLNSLHSTKIQSRTFKL